MHTHAAGRGRQDTALLLLTAIALIVVGGVVGVADNPPGLALVYAGTMVGLTAFVHRWREPRKFLRLFFGAVMGFVVFVVLHNLGYAAASVTDAAWLRAIWQALDVGAFLLAVLVAPAAFVVGGVGAVVTWLGRRSGPASPRL